MMFCGYKIPLRALRAGEDALASQERDIAISAVARAIEPLIPDSETAWKHATKWMAACSAAQQLILDATRAGALIPTGRHLGRATWSRKR